jgi:hypothetical protein
MYIFTAAALASVGHFWKADHRGPLVLANFPYLMSSPKITMMFRLTRQL